jgi:PKD repeat protein
LESADRFSDVRRTHSNSIYSEVELLSFARMRCAVADVLVLRLGGISSGAVLTLWLLTACGGGELMLPNTGSGAPTGIHVVDGDGQTGLAGEMLTSPLVVEVTDASGQPVAGATVAFELTSAGEGAEITPSTAVTDSAGHAEASMLLGDKIGLQTGEARVVVPGTITPSATFTALANAPSLGNRPPVADFNWHCDGLGCQFTDASGDDDGAVIGWSWQFGDGGTSREANPVHDYSGPGTYTVTLTVTDNDGASDQKTVHLDVTAPPPPPPDNKPPEADFDDHCHDLDCSFTDKSKDDDGSVMSWAWDFGDGTGSNQQSPTHSYEDEGHYDVTLTVTDDDGASSTRTHHADARD